MSQEFSLCPQFAKLHYLDSAIQGSFQHFVPLSHQARVPMSQGLSACGHLSVTAIGLSVPLLAASPRLLASTVSDPGCLSCTAIYAKTAT